MLILKLDSKLVLSRVFIPTELKGDGVVHYYINIDDGVLRGLKRLTELTPKQAFEIVQQYKDSKEGKAFLKELNGEQ